MAQRKVVGIVTLVLLIGAVVIIANRRDGRVEELQNTPVPTAITAPGLIEVAYAAEATTTPSATPVDGPEWEFANRLTAFALRYDAYDDELKRTMRLFDVNRISLSDNLASAEAALTRAEAELASFNEFQKTARETLRTTLAESTRELKDLTAKLRAIRSIGAKETPTPAAR